MAPGGAHVPNAAAMRHATSELRPGPMTPRTPEMLIIKVASSCMFLQACAPEVGAVREHSGWSWCAESNRGPTHYECVALPAELHQLSMPEQALVNDACRLRKVVRRGGIEPPTHGFSVRCSTS